MSFKKPVINKPVKSIESLQIFLRGVSKWGKTTLFHSLGMEKYGDPERYLLIGLGSEMGYKLLDNLQATQVETFEELLELQKWLIEQKGKEHNISMIGLDVVSEMLPMLEQYVCKLSFKETGKMCKSINSAFSGYGTGQKRMESILREFFTKFSKAGIGVILIGHTKVKSIKEKGSDDDGYNVLTSDLPNHIESLLYGMFDVILTGTVDKDVQNNKIQGTQRRLYFRGDGYVQSGVRFGENTDIPEYIVCEEQDNLARTVIDILEEGMRKSAINPVDKAEFKKQQKKEEADIEIKAQKYAESKETTGYTIEQKQDMLEKIKANLSSIEMSDLQKIMKEYNISSFKDAQTIPDKALDEILEFID